MAAQLSRVATQLIPIPKGRPKMVVPQVIGDVDSIVTQELRSALGQSNLIVVDLCPWESVVPSRLQWSMESTTDQTIDSAASWHIPYALCCRVTNWVVDSNKVQDLSIELRLINVETRQEIYSQEISYADCEPSPSERVFGVSKQGEQQWVSPQSVVSQPSTVSAERKLASFGTWIVVNLMLPWLGASFLTRAMRAHAPMTGLGLALGYLAVVLVSAWYLWGGFQSPWITTIALLLLAWPWLYYLEFVCRKLSD